MVGGLLLPGVARDQGEEASGATIALWPADPPKPLRLLLARAERSRDLDQHVGIGKVDREVPNLGEDDAAQVAGSELVVDPLPIGLRGLARDQRRRDVFRDGLDLVDVLADDEHRAVRIGVPCSWWSLAGFSAAMRNCARRDASAHSMRRSALMGTRTSTQLMPSSWVIWTWAWDRPWRCRASLHACIVQFGLCVFVAIHLASIASRGSAPRIVVIVALVVLVFARWAFCHGQGLVDRVGDVLARSAGRSGASWGRMLATASIAASSRDLSVFREVTRAATCAQAASTSQLPAAMTAS